MSRLICLLLLTSTMVVSFRTPEKPLYCRHKKHNQGQISTFLWRIKKQPPSYFFGTIHVPYTEVWEYVSPSARQAFARSNTVFLELDLNNPKTLRTLALCQMLPNGEKLQSYLPGDVYDKLERRMRSIKANLYEWFRLNEPGHTVSQAEHIFKSIAGNWERKRPVWIMLMLNSVNSDGIRHRGVPVLDLYLAREASASSKPLGAIENAHEQCQPLNSLNNTHIIYILNQTLSRRQSDVFDSNYASTAKDLVEHYNCGSLDEKIFTRDSIQMPELPESSHSTVMEEINSYFRRELITKRNGRMADRVVQILEAHPDRSFFFAFGAGHFLGEDSVINLVRRAGFRVQTVTPRNRSDKNRLRKGKNKGKNRSKHTRPSQQSEFESQQRVYQHNYIGTTAEPKRRNFNELWVRRVGFTPKPWREIEINSPQLSGQTGEYPKNYFLIQYNQKFCNYCSAAEYFEINFHLWFFSIIVLFIFNYSIEL